MANDPKKAGVESVGSAGMEALQEVKARVNSYSQYIPPRSAKGSVGWLHAPANMKMLKVSTYELMSVGVQRGVKVRQPSDIRYVRAAMLEGQTTVHIYPTDARDKDRIEIKRNSSGTWINLITLLGSEEMLVEVGYMEKFVITSVGAEGPFGPAITFDLSKPLERKLTEKRKKNGEGAPDNETAASSDPEV